jgi:hypothetical protein
VRRRVVDAVDHFARTGEGDVVRLVNVKPSEYRLRVGDWRVRFCERRLESAGSWQLGAGIL